MDTWTVLYMALAFVWVGGCSSVEVSLESSSEGGYFLWQAAGGRAQGPGLAEPPQGAALVHTDRFAVFQTSRPLAVRASYGPFSTKQTVPARSLVAEPSAGNVTDLPWGRHLDLSAHLVSKTVERDWGVVRVVMHTGAEPGAQRVCAVVHASLGTQSVSAACSPDSAEGMCLVEVALPWAWWPPLPRTKPPKAPPRIVSLAYTVVEPVRGPNCAPKVMIQSLTPLGNVQLVGASQGYESNTIDSHVKVLMPQRPLYPTSKLQIPTYITIKPSQKLTGVVIRARVKSGLKLLGAELVAKDEWNMTVEINAKQSVATVTVINKQLQPDDPSKNEEVVVWSVEVGEGGGMWQEGKLVWSVRAVGEGGRLFAPHHAKHKLTTRLHINKDDVHALIPISKNWELVNTAVLTGKQVSQGMKIVMVSHGGRLADVTLQASCHAPDDSVIKVSSSCSSVYVDGSEGRGSANATVVVNYGNLAAVASFTVWWPQEVELSIPDTRLSQIKGWRVPDTRINKLKRSPALDGNVIMMTEDNNVDKTTTCRLRYQQTNIDVYVKFMAKDHDSGRESYLVNRRTWLRVTQLVLSLLRVSDTRIASLKGNTLQGRFPGRTELQVVSALSGRVWGTKEVRVVNEKVSITRLGASVVSGLQLSISPDTGIDNGYIAQASVTRKLTAQYQEGLLDMEIVFSDGSVTPVSNLEREDYLLAVDTERPDIVAFAPQTPMSQPRVIAVAPGRGALLTVSVYPPASCSSKMPLASTHAHVDIEFTSGTSVTRPELVQNDGGAHREITADLHDILIGFPLKDDKEHEPTVQARQHHGSSGPHALTPLEIGMYVLLAGFCLAIVVFVVSCVVYASRFKADGVGAGVGGIAGGLEPHAARQQTTNAHDWVWLGRNTIHVTDNPIYHHHGPPIHNINHLHRQCEEIPPEVPPHRPTVDDGYRPPVPPHRAPLEGATGPPPPRKSHHHHHRRQPRPTVHGNPMFSELAPLDQLNMDYNQIMHYFDNLKESNA